MAAVRQELRAVLQGRAPTLEDLPRFELLDRVIKESLRLYPPVWLVERIAVADDVIQGFQIRRGDVLLVSPWVTHRRAALWPDPDRFDPDRFLSSAEAERPRNAYFPFIMGSRKCIGDVFAMTELRLVLATLLQRAALRLDSTRPVQPEAVVTLRPRGGVWMSMGVNEQSTPSLPAVGRA